MTFQEKYGPWAFVAGASAGIGAGFSHEAARRGLNVIMLARREEQLEATAAEIRAAHGVEVRTVAADLSASDVAERVAYAVGDREVGLFVHNAAVAPTGRFLDTPLRVEQRSIAVNCATLVTLTKQFAEPMAARGRGGIGIVSSMGAMAGSVNFAVYNATKAFDWILAETLWAELGDVGVDVSCIVVGATASPGYEAFQETLDPELCDRPDTDDPVDRARYRIMHPSEPAAVAPRLYDALGHGPLCFVTDDDEWVVRRTLDLPRAEAVGVWRAVQETATRAQDPTKRGGIRR